MIDSPGIQDNSSLRSLIEKPPVCNNSFSPLTGVMLTGFRLHTGPVSVCVCMRETKEGLPMHLLWVSHILLFACMIYVILSLLPKLPEQYRLMHIQPPKKKNKHKHKHHRPQDPLPPGDCHKQTHKEMNMNMLHIDCQSLFLLQKLHQIQTIRRRRKRRTMTRTERKRRKIRRKRRLIGVVIHFT